MERRSVLRGALVAMALTVGAIHLLRASSSPPYSLMQEPQQDLDDFGPTGYDFAAPVVEEPNLHARDVGDFANSTTQEDGIAKRWMAPESSPKEFDHYRCKGFQTLNMLFTAKENLGPFLVGGGDGQAPFGRRNLKDWERPDVDGAMATAQELQEFNYLRGVTSVEGFTSAGGTITLANGLKRGVLTQSKNYFREGSELPPTGAYYDFWQSGPEWMYSPLPNGHLRIWLQGASKYHRTYTNVPYWFVIKEVYGPPETLRIISWSMKLRAPFATAYPYWQHRQTFPIGSKCHAALMATPNSYAVAMYYMTHKYRFGNWAPGSVTIFSNGHVGPNGEMPTLIWWAGKADQKLFDARSQNSQAEIEWNQQEGNDPGRVPFPWPMGLV